MKVILLAVFGAVLHQPAYFQIKENHLTRATMYLSRYGYLPPNLNEPSTAALIDKKIFSKALTDFQYFFGLNKSGHLDADTRRLMETPRCGAPDKIYGEERRRQKRYTYMDPSKPQWNTTDLTYQMCNYSANVGRHMTYNQVDRDIKKAFDLWSEASALTFTRLYNGKADLQIGWSIYNHGDKFAFDGPKGELAHAFHPAPGIGGDTHFDDDETWTTGTKEGINLLQVATHEFGHALGLGHSRYRYAVMVPLYDGYSDVFKLHSDDIKGIQSLYGRPKGEKINDKITKPPPTVKINKLNELCSVYAKMDTMFTDNNSKTYVFRGYNYWELTEDGIVSGYPKAIESKWPKSPIFMDTALSYNSLTYFFKGNYVWCYSDYKLVYGFPKHIHQVFDGMPAYIDAAWYFGTDLYFFRADKYWKFDKNNQSEYPKSIQTYWKGVPDSISAAFKTTNKAYIIVKKEQYYNIDYQTRDIVKHKSAPSYPRNFKIWWLNCPHNPQRLYSNL
ncbi:hypothetical protein RUM44_003948 [Polyplax serrata]|uniref:Peptidase metallopeptidase domain-containing protein n=1 Tax=Polyplax serrata TaxID=468196 RepID=A0ABR1B258_POLSC